MFRAIGLRSLPLRGTATATPAWTSAWRRMLLLNPTQSLSRGILQQSNLHMARDITRQAASRPGLTFSRIQRRGFRFSPWRRNTTQSGTQEKLTLSQRLKKLSREYGWSAVGVYLTLSVLDFPFCFLLVRIVGTDTIGMLFCSLPYQNNDRKGVMKRVYIVQGG